LVAFKTRWYSLHAWLVLVSTVAAVAGKASQSKKEVLVTNAADALIDETRMPSELTASAEVDQLNINSSASVDLLREARDQDINVLGILELQLGYMLVW